MNAEELQNNMISFSQTYFLQDLRNDKEAFYALTPEDFKNYPYCIGGYVLNLFLDGRLDEANAFIETLPKDSVLYLGLVLVNPTVSWKDFIHLLDHLKESNQSIPKLVLTGGRPYLLNGFNDFTRLGPIIARNKERFLEDLTFLYGKEGATFLYRLCLAEYYYQENRLVDAELLVSQTIKEFDKQNEFRFLFTAMFLEAKIAVANGTILKSSSYIKAINTRVKELGKAEFSLNIDAAEAHMAFYSGNFEVLSSWLKNNAPDEVGDFNMLDLYRYMVKIRCYIVHEEISTAVSLIEKLRPYLEQGPRRMDLCEIDLLLAEALYAAGNTETALEALGRALKEARRRKYIRLVADEGVALFELLVEYTKRNGETPFLSQLIELTRRMTILYPQYLKPRIKNNEQFSQMEVDILNLLEQGKNYEEIGSYFFISVNTVKYHVKKIYSKLNADNANKAVWNAKLLGLIK